MSATPDPDWHGTVRVGRPDTASADRLVRALAPEAAREVPRARAEVRLAPGPSVEVVVRARDTGALRAALNTYLGWVALSLRTERAGVAGPRRD